MTLDPLCCKVANAFQAGNRWSVAHFRWWAYWSLLLALIELQCVRSLLFKVVNVFKIVGRNRSDVDLGLKPLFSIQL